MLKELRISNFRLFDDEVTLRFRPITVLIGRNNSGKSSIIKFLLMLQQSLGIGNPNLLQPEGDRVRFGPFENLKNSLTQKQQLEFELKVSDLHPLGGGFGLPNYLKGQGYLEPGETDIEKDRLLYATKAMIHTIRMVATEENTWNTRRGFFWILKKYLWSITFQMKIIDC